MTNNPGQPFICCITPSNIAYVLAIIKNAKDAWDQAKNPGKSPEKKVRPLFSSGERRKREREWYISVEQGRFGVLLNSGEKLERGVQFQGAIFCSD